MNQERIQGFANLGAVTTVQALSAAKQIGMVNTTEELTAMIQAGMETTIEEVLAAINEETKSEGDTTLIVYNPMDAELQYVIVNGDFSRFNGVCVNSGNGNGFEQEFCDWFFDAEGKYRLSMSTDSSVIEKKKWAKIAIVTWLP
jgi:hypothetical protein